MGSYAGIDWASEKHDVLIADEHGDRLLAETFVPDEQGVAALCDALVCFEVDVVAIERGDGVLVERLLEAGVRVLGLHSGSGRLRGFCRSSLSRAPGRASGATAFLHAYAVPPGFCV